MKFSALLSLVLASFGAASTMATEKKAATPGPITVTALINEPIMPVARSEKYGQPLQAFLDQENLGEIVGAGTALSPNGGPAWVELVIELTAPADSSERVARKLRDLGAPEGSHLYYFVGESRRNVPIR